MIRKLEKYEILEEIGHGGMATVYRARDTVLDRTVALKVMHPHLRGAEEARRRFHREARSVARLRHPRVIEIYDFSGEGSEESYIAMELLTGPTLKQWREEQTELPAEIAACFVIEIAKALESAHAANIVHRDVKPENVLLHEQRTLKLTDFGIADMIDAISMTATGQILGSPGHMAPEQIEGRDSDTRTDLFSLGTVLYYLATGRLPFTGRNPHQVLKRIVDGEYADPLRVNPAIGGGLREIIVKSLERELGARYQTAKEFREALEAFVKKVGIDKPDEALAEYLQDPEGAKARLTKRTIDALIDEGSRASDAGDVPKALDCYNRVLALDDGNERVLKLIERVGLDRTRRMMLIAGVSLCAVGLGFGGLAWAVWSTPDDPIEPIANADVDAAVVVDVNGSDAAASDAAIVADAGERTDAATGDAGVSDAGRRDAGRVRVAVNEPSDRTRVVRIIPTIGNATLEVDGQPLEGREIELTLGWHTVTVVPGQRAEASYRRTENRVEVESSTAELRVSAELQDALIVVDSAVPGQVTVTQGASGTGRTGRVIYVSMRAEVSSPLITVSAPGYENWTTRETLHAGGAAVRISADLRRGGLAEVP
ncbi:MAG: protein kinase [Sandaracinaceae bacterium]